MRLDPNDKNILKHLNRDSGQSIEAIADSIGLSRNACWRRIKRLEEDGYIKGRMAVLDREKLNLSLSVFISVQASEHNAEWLSRFRQAVMPFPEIVGVYRMTGQVDYVIRAVVPDMKAYDAFYKRLISKIDLEDVSSSFVMEEIKDTAELPLDYA